MQLQRSWLDSHLIDWTGVYSRSVRKIPFCVFSSLIDRKISDPTRAHVLAWRKTLEEKSLAGATIRRKLAALASLFEHLSESNLVTHNPVKGVKRPVVESQQGKTPALGEPKRGHF